MRTLFMLLALVLFSGSINLYIYNFHNTEINLRTLQMWYGGTIILGLLIHRLDVHMGDESWLQVNFREILFWAVILNLFTTWLWHFFGWSRDEYKVKYYIFDGAIVITTLVIFTSGLRHGLFKTNEK